MLSGMLTLNNVKHLQSSWCANPKPVFISETLSPREKEDLIKLVKEYIYIFTWSYEDMPDLDLKVATYWLNIHREAKPIM